MENKVFNAAKLAIFKHYASASSRNSKLSTFQSRLLHQTLRATLCQTSALKRLSQHDSTSYKTMQVAEFHASSRKLILPALPQVIEGTANDPARVPDPSPTHGSYHWVFERFMSAALVPLTVAPFAAGTLNPMTDALLCATILIHSHIGFQSIIIDYIPTHRLPMTRRVFWWGLRVATLVVGVGFYEFETNDVGLTEGIKRIWKA